jgi:ATP-dependent Lhr-like helicase
VLIDGAPKGEGMFGTGRVGGPFHAHHGSVSREVRLDLELKLKAGELPALIATGTLELGIDIGDVDAVVQLQSPHGIARGLQRVGRAGHQVGQTSVGRIFATYREDLLDAGAVVHGMLAGDIEPTHTPQNCLDVLAQQIVAMVSVQDWDVEALYRLVCQAYGFGRLTQDILEAVLKMLSGGYPAEVYTELRPRLAWDRVNGKLAALPAARLLAIRNGGTIVDRGEFRVYLPDGKTVLGVLDEEFVYETRKGDVFTLGSNTWRVLDMTDDRLVVGDAAGSLPRMPFWHGEMPKRDYHMGLRLGRFRRELAARVADLPPLPEAVDGVWPVEAESVIAWLSDEYGMDDWSARNAMHYVRRQLDVLGAISSDRTIIVERFTDALGDGHMVIHSPFGARVNSAWALALSHALQELLGGKPETQANDNGILFHFIQADREPPIHLVHEMSGQEARERLLLELPNSALFGAEFRMSASRALLLPGFKGGAKRTPFWLQRLRSRTLLAASKNLDDFPITAETYRACLNDVLDLPHLLDVLASIQAGEIQVVEAETIIPSPVAEGLLYGHKEQNMYVYDDPIAEQHLQALTFSRDLLAQLVDEGLLPDLLRPQALTEVEAELQHLAEGYKARGPEELAVMLHDLGDLSTEEVQARCLGEGRAWLLRLMTEGRAFQISVPTAYGPAPRWISAEDYWRYRDAFGLPDEPPAPLPEALLAPRHTLESAQEILLRQVMRTHGPLTRARIGERYGFDADWLENTLQELVTLDVLVTGALTSEASERQWCDRHVLERLHRRTLSLLRAEVQPVDLPAYADFCARWQGAHPAHRDAGQEGLLAVMQQQRGLAAPAAAWERDLLPARLAPYRPGDLDALTQQEGLSWAVYGNEARHARARFFFRGEGGLFLTAAPSEETLATLDPGARRVMDYIRQEGACYTADIQRGLGFSTGATDEALVALLLAGLITNDSAEALRTLIAGTFGEPDASAGVRSSLDNDLAAWRATRGPAIAERHGRFQRPSQDRLREARRLAAQRAAATGTPQATRWRGRWALVHRSGLLGDPPSEMARAERLAHLLLDRYGVLCRECLENEESDLTWGAVYPTLANLELRGLVRRGYFVRGLSGVQFALPEALDQLRAWSRPEAEESDALVLLNAWDPALIYGPALSGARSAASGGVDAGLPEDANPYRFARLPSNYVVLQRGVPVLVYEHGGHRWKALPGLADEPVREAVRLLRDHLIRAGGLCAQPRRVLVETWNGSAASGSQAQALLEDLGFRREPPALVWDGL